LAAVSAAAHPASTRAIYSPNEKGGLRLGRWRELDHLTFAVVADLALEGAQVVGVINLGDANEPHRHAACWARRLKCRDRSVGFRMKLRHVRPHAQQLTDAKFSNGAMVPVKGAAPRMFKTGSAAD
jgi:hypothetical protein